MTSSSAGLVGVMALVCFGSSVLAAQVPRVEVGGEIKRPAVIHHVAPVYPKEAKDKKTGGTVVLAIVIATDGSILEVTVAKSVHPLLDEAATNAVSQWKYAPPKVNGEPVELTMTVDITFTVPSA